MVEDVVVCAWWKLWQLRVFKAVVSVYDSLRLDFVNVLFQHSEARGGEYTHWLLRFLHQPISV